MIAATAPYIAAEAAARNGGKPIFRLEITDYARVFSTRPDAADGGAFPWIATIGSCEQSVDDLNGSSTLGDLSLTVIDRRRLMTADLPTNQLEGRKAFFKVGYPGLAIADYTTLFTGLVNRVETSGDGCSYDFTLQDMNRLNQQVIYLTGDDGSPTDKDHPKTLVGNPMDLLISVLRDYIGVADSDINLTKINLYRDQMFGGMEFAFKITSPPDAKNFIEQELMKPLGGYFYTDNLGRYTVDFMQPLGGAASSVLTLDNTVLNEIPSLQQSDLVNTVSCRFDKVDSDFDSEAVNIYGASVDLFGTQGQIVIESAGVRSGFQGFSLFRLTSRAIFNRYGLKNPRIETHANWKAGRLQVGDYVMVNHPKVPNRVTGTLGINQLMQVIDRTWNFAERSVDLTLVDASKVSTFGGLKVAPNGTPDWTSATTLQKSTYLFIGNASGQQSDGAANGRLG